MKLARAKDVESGDIFLFQAPDQPIRAWIHLGVVQSGEKVGQVWAESLYSYGEFKGWTPGERLVSGGQPVNHYPTKYLWLQGHTNVLA